MSSSDEPSQKPSATPLIEFGDVLALLAKHGVQFLTVGGVAVSLNGFVRSTVDVDILVEGSRENLRRMLHALGTFGQGYAKELTVEDFSFEEGSIRIAEAFDIDIFVQMREQRYEHMIGQALFVDYAGQRIPYLNARQLIELKKTSSREKDLLDVQALTNLLREKEQE
ncbi:MAG: hypothetical protein EXS18_01575 [Verrucomicrobiae bacterium]|nr:hypothetical protein [Verrucomicrobiae bacterium]